MITLWDKKNDNRKEHFLSLSTGEKHGLLYLRNLEKSEYIELPHELFRVKFLAGKNVYSANVSKDRTGLVIKDRNKKGSALILLTSLCEKDSMRAFLCGDVEDKGKWKEYLEETDNLDFSSDIVQKISLKIAKERGLLLGDNRNCYTRASNAFNWVRDNISYSILPRYAVMQIADTIRKSSLKWKRDVYFILRTTFPHLPSSSLREISSQAIIPDYIEDPYEQALYITTKFGSLWKLFFYTWEGKKTRSASRTIEDRSGKCDCISHTFVALCRSMGIPAMMIKGYYADVGWHAWAAVYLSPYGWVEIDPTIGGSFLHFNQSNYSYEFLNSEFKGEKQILSIDKILCKDCLTRCKTFYEKADGHPSFEEINDVLYSG